MPGSLGQPSFFGYTAIVRFRSQRFLPILLMLALPLQAFASAAMLVCTFSHRTALESMMPVDETMAGCHETQQTDAPAVQHDCKHCAACALASALAIPAADTPAIVSASHRFDPQSAAAFGGFVPEGPERPPRPSLA
jgi:hypothetical protein